MKESIIVDGKEKEVTLSDIFKGDVYGNRINCPHCNSNYINSVGTDVFLRSEDSENGIHVSCGESEVLTTANMVGNPSPRRHGMLISFECEDCTKKSTLAIYQHKGSTYIGWVN